MAVKMVTEDGRATLQGLRLSGASLRRENALYVTGVCQITEKGRLHSSFTK